MHFWGQGQSCWVNWGRCKNAFVRTYIIIVISCQVVNHAKHTIPRLDLIFNPWAFFYVRGLGFLLFWHHLNHLLLKVIGLCFSKFEVYCWFGTWICQLCVFAKKKSTDLVLLELAAGPRSGHLDLLAVSPPLHLGVRSRTNEVSPPAHLDNDWEPRVAPSSCVPTRVRVRS